MEQNSLFDNIKYCTICHRPLSQEYQNEICPVCEENELFGRVKDFIRSKDVTEYEVAEEFHLPLRKIKGWIKEGRIEYKEINLNTIQELHCASCGEPIKFGTYCQNCYKKANTTQAVYVIKKKEDDKMRFLE